MKAWILAAAAAAALIGTVLWWAATRNSAPPPGAGGTPTLTATATSTSTAIGPPGSSAGSPATATSPATGGSTAGSTGAEIEGAAGAPRAGGPNAPRGARGDGVLDFSGRDVGVPRNTEEEDVELHPRSPTPGPVAAASPSPQPEASPAPRFPEEGVIYGSFELSPAFALFTQSVRDPLDAALNRWPTEPANAPTPDELSAQLIMERSQGLHLGVFDNQRTGKRVRFASCLEARERPVQGFTSGWYQWHTGFTVHYKGWVNPLLRSQDRLGFFPLPCSLFAREIPQGMTCKAVVMALDFKRLPPAAEASIETYPWKVSVRDAKGQWKQIGTAASRRLLGDYCLQSEHEYYPKKR